MFCFCLAFNFLSLMLACEHCYDIDTVLFAQGDDDIRTMLTKRDKNGKNALSYVISGCTDKRNNF